MLIYQKLIKLAQKLDDKQQYDLADKIWKNRPLMLPLENQERTKYVENAFGFIPPEELDPYLESDLPLIHVTGNLPSVLEHGLLSRNLLKKINYPNNLGLGGQVLGQNPKQVSTTYSEEKADAIFSALMLIANINIGKAKINDILDYLDALADRYLYDEEDPLYEEMETEALKIDENDPREKYNFLQKYENEIISWLGESYDTPERIIPFGIAGLAANYDSVKHLKPENIEKLYLKAKEGTQPGHYPTEAELTFYPQDLYIDDDRLLPHERELLQKYIGDK